jgi:hypothetical protein
VAGTFARSSATNASKNGGGQLSFGGAKRSKTEMTNKSREQLLALADEEFTDEEEKEFQRVEKLAFKINKLFQGSNVTTSIDAFCMVMALEMPLIPVSERLHVAKLLLHRVGALVRQLKIADVH